MKRFRYEIANYTTQHWKGVLLEGKMQEKEKCSALSYAVRTLFRLDSDGVALYNILCQLIGIVGK